MCWIARRTQTDLQKTPATALSETTARCDNKKQDLAERVPSPGEQEVVLPSS